MLTPPTSAQHPISSPHTIQTPEQTKPQDIKANLFCVRQQLIDIRNEIGRLEDSRTKLKEIEEYSKLSTEYFNRSLLDFKSKTEKLKNIEDKPLRLKNGHIKTTNYRHCFNPINRFIYAKQSALLCKHYGLDRHTLPTRSNIENHLRTGIIISDKLKNEFSVKLSETEKNISDLKEEKNKKESLELQYENELKKFPSYLSANTDHIPNISDRRLLGMIRLGMNRKDILWQLAKEGEFERYGKRDADLRNKIGYRIKTLKTEAR